MLAACHSSASGHHSRVTLVGKTARGEGVVDARTTATVSACLHGLSEQVDVCGGPGDDQVLTPASMLAVNSCSTLGQSSKQLDNVALRKQTMVTLQSQNTLTVTVLSH